jgi:hypothetical protein
MKLEIEKLKKKIEFIDRDEGKNDIKSLVEMYTDNLIIDAFCVLYPNVSSAIFDKSFIVYDDDIRIDRAFDALYPEREEKEVIKKENIIFNKIMRAENLNEENLNTEDKENKKENFNDILRNRYNAAGAFNRIFVRKDVMNNEKL